MPLARARQWVWRCCTSKPRVDNGAVAVNVAIVGEGADQNCTRPRAYWWGTFATRWRYGVAMSGRRPSAQASLSQGNRRVAAAVLSTTKSIANDDGALFPRRQSKVLASTGRFNIPTTVTKDRPCPS